ncbi:Spermidine/putrescine ABC transporter spermidine/putrescine-binding protein [uncultured Eubacteriales bacterium]|uniref:Spermidine/putrescine ABC transporter spermidine/putrescine-binding protein n=1 Tax=uncultured Eubacteriales bacterium TaxID=172733 RepID=A0A212K1E0_9FIRM|nr:Spermidine/putrescine ABC transporter spermidine/putrescine-binding protein [uncultured Eubacteriales bacterium]
MLSAAMLVGALSGCGSTGAAKNEVKVYNWGEYIDESIFDDFEAQTGIKVVYRTFTDNESMYANLSSGGADYDVIIPSDYMISRMIDEDMLEKLDFANIPNFSDIDPTLKNPDYDPTGEYSVPYTWGTVGIIYNTTKVTKPVDSWDILFDSDYAGQILMFDNSRDAIGIALKYLGYSYNTTDEQQIKEAVDLLVQQRSDGLVQSYVMDQIFDKLEGGEAAIGPYYAGDFITMHEVNPDLAFCLPKEGSNVFVDAMCIPKGAVNKANAEAFINFMCSTDAGLANCEATGYSTPLLSVRDALPDEVKNDSVAYPDSEALSRCESFVNLPQNILDLYDSEWLRLKT